MNKEPKKYGLLIGVERYENEELKSLPAAVRDLALMKSALTDGLKFDADDIRVLGESGAVPARSFARALSEFEGLISEEDTFVLYFGCNGVLFQSFASCIRHHAVCVYLHKALPFRDSAERFDRRYLLLFAFFFTALSSS